jgi:hypothetical protein
MAAKRHATSTITRPHGVTPPPAYTYVTIQHGRHTKQQHGRRASTHIPYYPSTRRHTRRSPLTHTSPYNMAADTSTQPTYTKKISKLSTHSHDAFFRMEWIQPASQRVDSTGYYSNNNHIKFRALTYKLGPVTSVRLAIQQARLTVKVKLDRWSLTSTVTPKPFIHLGLSQKQGCPLSQPRPSL